MAEKKYVEVWVNDQTGDVRIEAFGMVGTECQDKTKFLEEAIGGSVVDFKKKKEWYLSNAKQVREGIKNFGIQTDKLCG